MWPSSLSVFIRGSLTICRQTQNNHSENALHGAQSEHQRETHFEYRKIFGW